MITIVLVIALTVYAVSKIVEKKKKEFSALIDLALHESEYLQKTQSAVDFVNTWNSLVNHAEKINKTYRRAYGKESKKYVSELMSSLRNIRDSEEFYWLLRNAIDRNKRRAIKNIKITYRNSQSFKTQEYERFCEDIDLAKHVFNAETVDFANACIDEVSYALGGTSTRRIPSNNEYVAEQRRLVTPSLRYDIMKRDGFRCVICGRGADDGVKLHVDHIKPVSKGGKSTPSNLRTLCQDCNLGKSAKYDSDNSAYSIDELELYSAIDDD